ncbi:TPA: outer membrane lipoprotein-sorting protein [Vibrio parahaemolyticus]|uniref:outer membrane lipoprotein-sorting protein n=1 Tax=Vibrio parahaemolyticus TaxID=670 RepID=UPI00079FEE0B|nr:outer membrane lipoprotein-sorting protein [Vibrio parahaemolyticus]EJG0764362.1 outer membrane lipoprotein-sorting protein [Vibrio parahaemolyticus O5:K30]EGQ9349738.1 outer membrane lipoprotein-sorting protein [Vibrio parahaemolyticus]EGQ9516418.1 outer membrane lipoprotein-sorting protein [Vibrio parahaemolyticus]EGR2178254.1 outer membrane lipoprotein-sorting protein [Vibrio parahaemolyticus]EIM7931168.1 outer membrane lipoprotein-sorting protein [Vibrio parahaemolyticus]
MPKIVAALFFLLFTSLSYAESAFDIVQKSDQAMRGKSSYSEATMEIVRPDWTRSMTMKSWTKGTELSLVLVTAPAKDKGSASLKRHREMWNWVPSIERVIKIAPSMLSQSWMGSDFTNDDLINQSSIVVDYQHALVGNDSFEGDKVWVIEATAKPDAPVVWNKVSLWISQSTYLQRKVEFYDEFDERVNVLTTYDVKELGGRKIATRMEMKPVDKPGNKTIFTTHQAQFDFDINDDFFSQQQMKSLRD